ncbi:hypothetical protein MLD38_016904 [Melastoma candidum]|uniref:Uncharacterized protein n=1 Tax=Melastoma candidum TaxID=119954 RepID=A0ACB9QQS6_9MYRT|nr:hypothetical protein MLD38_016904 [Melastoma candidum]
MPCLAIPDLVGQSNLQPFYPPNPDDIATICYTSGTTGTPKGAVLTHGSLVASVAGSTMNTKFYPSDVAISYLPLAHIYERANQIMAVHFGIAVGFYQGDNLKLMDDMATLRPTVFASVPRLYNRIYSGIINAVKASGGLRERLFNAAYNAKKQALLNGKNASPMWDRLVFNKIKEKLGGRVRFMSSGASPLSPDVMEFLTICFGCRVVEGYGMTETSCVISSMDEGDCLFGHVGSPSPACEIKLVDVPEMNYTSEDQPYPRGEICVRGPIIFKGYYKDEAQTREVFDEDGWFHTGDIGTWLSGGRLKIIDRKKNIFKLAQGEYIAPEKIENVYAKCKFVAQCFLYGDSLNACLVAIVSVDQDQLKAWAASEGIKYQSLDQLCIDPRAKAAVSGRHGTIGREAQVKRPQAKHTLEKAINDMYAQLSLADPSLNTILKRQRVSMPGSCFEQQLPLQPQIDAASGVESSVAADSAELLRRRGARVGAATLSGADVLLLWGILGRQQLQSSSERSASSFRQALENSMTLTNRGDGDLSRSKTLQAPAEPLPHCQEVSDGSANASSKTTGILLTLTLQLCQFAGTAVELRGMEHLRGKEWSIEEGHRLWMGSSVGRSCPMHVWIAKLIAAAAPVGATAELATDTAAAPALLLYCLRWETSKTQIEQNSQRQRHAAGSEGI